MCLRTLLIGSSTDLSLTMSPYLRDRRLDVRAVFTHSFSFSESVIADAASSEILQALLPVAQCELDNWFPGTFRALSGY